MPQFKLGEMKFPDVKIGEVQVPQHATVPPPGSIGAPQQAAIGTAPQPIAHVPHVPHPAEPDELLQEPRRGKIPIPKLDPQALFKIVGADKKIYGPVSGEELAQWMAEGRVQLSTLIQKIGNKKWQQVAELLTREMPQEIPMPPPLRKMFGKKPDDKVK